LASQIRFLKQYLRIRITGSILASSATFYSKGREIKPRPSWLSILDKIFRYERTGIIKVLFYKYHLLEDFLRWQRTGGNQGSGLRTAEQGLRTGSKTGQGLRTGNTRTRAENWELENKDSGLGTIEQGLRTGNNRTRAEDWEQENKGSGLGTTEQGLRTGNRLKAQDLEQQIKGLGLTQEIKGSKEGFRSGNNRLKA
jgi:hypothetical protein